MDAKDLKFPNSFFDLIIMSSVVEHLYPEELELAFGEVKRVLKPKGKLVVSTAPNKIFNDIAYKYYAYPMSKFLTSVWNKITSSKYPNISTPHSIRKESHHIMHINEPTYFSLRKLYYKYGFHGSILSTNITAKKTLLGLQDLIFNFIVFLDPISRKFPLNIMFGSDFLAVLVNKK